MGHSNAVSAMAWSLDGQQPASGSGDNTIKVWAASTGQLLATLLEAAEIILLLISPEFVASEYC
ncbi:MAG: WD40 repeat domain-containing protein [Candidatus Binatia bacterium]